MKEGQARDRACPSFSVRLAARSVLVQIRIVLVPRGRADRTEAASALVAVERTIVVTAVVVAIMAVGIPITVAIGVTIAIAVVVGARPRPCSRVLDDHLDTPILRASRRIVLAVERVRSHRVALPEPARAQPDIVDALALGRAADALGTRLGELALLGLDLALPLDVAPALALELVPTRAPSPPPISAPLPA